MSIPESEWRWRGMPGHLIVADSCCFHLVTDIGEHRISTIGCYHRPDVDDKHYGNRTTIGADRLYETLVFPLDGDQITEWTELDGDGYNKEADAEAGHMVMCHKWAAKVPAPSSPAA